jgi:hypothetical protein
MASARRYEATDGDRLLVAERLVLAHRFARPVVREIRLAPGLGPAPAVDRGAGSGRGDLRKIAPPAAVARELHAA